MHGTVKCTVNILLNTDRFCTSTTHISEIAVQSEIVQTNINLNKIQICTTTYKIFDIWKIDWLLPE